jgi:GxxExxY protein
MAEADKVEFPHGSITGRIIAGLFEVFRELGYGFSEVVYRRALAIALRAAGLNVRELAPLQVWFRGAVIGTFEADLVVENTVIVEVKAAAAIDAYAEAQVLNYLKCAGGGVGMVVNFGRRPDFKRMVMGDAANSLPLLDQSPPNLE